MLLISPDDIDANNVLGVFINLGDPKKGSICLSDTVALSKWQQPPAAANYIESLRSGNGLLDTWTASICGVELHHSLIHILYDAGIVARDIGNYSIAFNLFKRAVRADPM